MEANQIFTRDMSASFSDIIDKLTSSLVGQVFAWTERQEHEWMFHLAGTTYLKAMCPWRIVRNGRIAFGDEDDAQKFGFPVAVDGATKSDSLLHDKTIKKVVVREDTGDLTVEFSDQTFLETLNNSSGYEGWELQDEAGLNVVAVGGGELVSFVNK